MWKDRAKRAEVALDIRNLLVIGSGGSCFTLERVDGTILARMNMF